MAKIKIYQIAKELGYESKEVIQRANELGIEVKTASSAVEEDIAQIIYLHSKGEEIPQEFQETLDKLKKPAKKTKKKEETLKKTETKKESPKKAKEETKPEIKEEILNQEPQQSIASETLAKRRGLVIVKKKAKEETKPEIKDKVSLSTMFSNTEENLKKKKNSKKSAIKKENAEKMDFLNDHDFAELDLEDENEVVLPDFSFHKKEQETPTNTNKQPNFLRQANNSYNLEGGIHRRSRKKPPKKVEKKENQTINSIEIPKEIRVYEFADKMGKSTAEVISKLFMLGVMTTKNDFLDETAIEILASEFNIEVKIIDEALEFDYLKDYKEDDKNLEPRAPVITIMGHVDHGKTSLLDYIRNSRITNSEAGGITQHVGAYMVEKNQRKITFIDTPGHEAFTSMRARGASITDIVVIVVAADDGVKPQTKEAINHAKAANVPIIIAINKIDKETANPDMVKTQLAELEIMPLEWGGKHEFINISAKTGQGIDDLLEILLLQADILELKANPKSFAKASIIESSMQKGRGAVATIIVQNGTLRVGNTVVAGVSYGKIRAINDDLGKAIKEVKPGECAEIIGLSEVASSGEILLALASDKEAREYANKRLEYNRQKELSKSTKVSLDELGAKIQEGNLKTLSIILKTDVQGSLEAIKLSLEKLSNEEIKVNIIHSGVGGITQSDIELASASSCFVFGFNIRPTGEIKEKAKDKGIEIKTFNVIYNLIDEAKALLSGMMNPVICEEQLGQALIRQVISVPKIGQIAGCMVTEGTINRGAKIRLIRDGVVVFEGNVSSLKRFKDDVKEVAKGYECGIGIENYNDLKEGDYIESYKEIEQRANL